TSEYSSRRWRSAAIGIQVTGYPIGATLGGTVAALLITSFGWRSAFLFGAFCSALIVPAVVAGLPESLDFLMARRPKDALPRLNHLLRLMGRPPLEALPAAEDGAAGRARNPIGRLFAGPASRSTLLIWSAFFLLMFSFYFVTSWTPRLLVAAGLSTREGITGGVLLNLGGIAGGTLFGWLASGRELRLVAAAYIGCLAGSLLLFGLFANDLRTALPIALAIGVFLFGSMVGLYAATPLLYPAEIRSTGMGW